jgi:hypothetical protein
VDLNAFLTKYVIDNQLFSGALCTYEGTTIASTATWNENQKNVSEIISEIYKYAPTTQMLPLEAVSRITTKFTIISKQPEKLIVGVAPNYAFTAVVLADSSILFIIHSQNCFSTPRAVTITYSMAEFLEKNLGRGSRTKSAHKV